jgi:hypothetical protein
MVGGKSAAERLEADGRRHVLRFAWIHFRFGG